jgi:calcineurin-like phosphoesterase family protein
MKSLFYKPIVENEKENDVLFWGCIHYGHNPNWPIPLWQTRGFKDVYEHDFTILNNWNSKANHNTVGFLLGDNIFGYNAHERLIGLFEAISFKKLYVMPGNHQAGWKQIFESVEGNTYHTASGKEVIFVPNYLEATIGGQEIVMSHYPLASWNRQSKGSFMIHSHTHANLYKNELGKLLYRAKIIDVGVENCPFPLSLAEIKHKFRQMDVTVFDHHS